MKPVLDTYVAPWESAVRAYSAGGTMYASCYELYRGYDRTEEISKLSNNELLYRLFWDAVLALSFINEANRLKIFEGTRWNRHFIVAIAALIFFNSLVYYKNHFNKPWAKPLVIISKASWRYSPLIKGITRVVFTIFEFHQRPKQAVVCGFLGGCVCVLRARKGTSKTIQSLIQNMDICTGGIRFYVGNRFEKVLIAAYFIHYVLYKCTDNSRDPAKPRVEDPLPSSEELKSETVALEKKCQELKENISQLKNKLLDYPSVESKPPPEDSPSYKELNLGIIVLQEKRRKLKGNISQLKDKLQKDSQDQEKPLLEDSLSYKKFKLEMLALEEKYLELSKFF